MLIVPDTKSPTETSKAAEAAAEQSPNVTDVQPPSYTSLSAAGPSIPGPTGFTLPVSVKPSNNVYVSQSNSSIKSTYVIDPSIEVPSSLLPPLEPGETVHRNLSLLSKNGSINAEVHVVPVEGAYRPVTMYIKSHNGSITATVHRSTESPTISLEAFSHNGSVNVRIPRSYRGPISATTHNGSVKFSDGVQPQLTTFSDVRGVQKSFVGDISGYTGGEAKDWRGDQVVVESKNGGIRIQYDDEIIESPVKSLLGRLFGR